MSRKGLNIYKRKDGRWEARYIKSRNALGKPKYGYLYASSYREVRCDLQHTLQLQGKPSGSEERTRNSTFELVSMEWLDAFSINFKESTYIRYDPRSNVYLAQPGSSKELFYVNDKLVLNPIELKAIHRFRFGDGRGLFASQGLESWNELLDLAGL